MGLKKILLLVPSLTFYLTAVLAEDGVEEHRLGEKRAKSDDHVQEDHEVAARQSVDLSFSMDIPPPTSEPITSTPPEPMPTPKPSKKPTGKPEPTPEPVTATPETPALGICFRPNCQKPSDGTSLVEFFETLHGVAKATLETTWGELSTKEQEDLVGYNETAVKALDAFQKYLDMTANIIVSVQDLQGSACSDVDDFMNSMDEGGLLLELDAYETLLNTKTVSDDRKKKGKEQVYDTLDKIIQRVKKGFGWWVPKWVLELLCTIIDVLLEILRFLA